MAIAKNDGDDDRYEHGRRDDRDAPLSWRGQGKKRWVSEREARASVHDPDARTIRVRRHALKASAKRLELAAPHRFTRRTESLGGDLSVRPGTPVMDHRLADSPATAAFLSHSNFVSAATPCREAASEERGVFSVDPTATFRPDIIQNLRMLGKEVARAPTLRPRLSRILYADGGNIRDCGAYSVYE
jgi:hypothetical protein